MSITVRSQVVAWGITALTALAVAAPSGAAMIALGPIADSYTFSTMPTVNYGSDPILSSGDAISGNTLQLWTTFLKFDLTSIPDGMTITGATLHMYQVNGAGFLDSGTDVSHVADDTWSEGGVTWNSQPVIGSVLGTSPDPKSHRGWSQWDLFETAQWNSTGDQLDDLLSLAVGESGGSSTHNWCSEESDLVNCLAPGEIGPAEALRRPRLEITYVPEPSTALLIGFGLAIFGWRRRASLTAVDQRRP